MKNTAIIGNIVRLSQSALSLILSKTKIGFYQDLSLDTGNFVYATMNDSDRLLGQYYFDEGTCVYIVTLGITCTEGSEYPSIINSSAGLLKRFDAPINLKAKIPFLLHLLMMWIILLGKHPI